MLLFIISIILVGGISSYAGDAPTITSPASNGEYDIESPIVVYWNSPTDTSAVPYEYKIRVTRVSISVDDNGNTLLTSLPTYETTVSASLTNYFTLPQVYVDSNGAVRELLQYDLKYSVSVGAVYSNTNISYSNSVPFFTTSHSGVFDPALSFSIWSGFGDTTKEQIYYSFNAWNTSMDLGYEVANTYPFSMCHSENVYPSGDGENRITGVSVGAGEYLMQTTTYRYSSGVDAGKVIEADINVNKSYSWANSPTNNRYDVQNVMTHEVGHVLGLVEHYESWAVNLTMYGFSDINESKKRTPESHDITYAKRIYGN